MVSLMTRYPVYLEIDRSGCCMAHVLDIPGCTASGDSREQALGRLPATIRAAHTWLRRYAEPAPSPNEPVELEVAEEIVGPGPFKPGDTAALFTPDCQPLTRAEMERSFTHMAYARGDLLALVQDLTDENLDWQPSPESFSIRRVLRHIGNAEEWYVSRLVPPETLPAEWEHDEALPVLQFLEMERRTAIERLRRLTGTELAGVFHPTCWTEHPEEAWTARKALRRFLEHEREHTAQVSEILALFQESTGMVME
jgi:predicted RNase H-like HicB family nuclease/uncharacterized damage-inducible protein DinB